MNTRLASLHGDFQGSPNKIDNNLFCTSSAQNINIEVNKCIENSYRFAVQNGCMIVEGILLTQIDDHVNSVQPHCWNKWDGKYYDVTIEQLHTTDDYQAIIGHRKEVLIYFECVEYQPQESGYSDDGISTFYYNYDALVEYFRSSLKRKHCLINYLKSCLNFVQYVIKNGLMNFRSVL